MILTYFNLLKYMHKNNGLNFTKRSANKNYNEILLHNMKLQNLKSDNRSVDEAIEK